MAESVVLDPIIPPFGPSLYWALDARAPVMIQLSAVDAWQIMAQLQLALRHPTNKGPSSKVADLGARIFQRDLATTPALAVIEILARILIAT